MTREKVVAHSAARRVYLVQTKKLVKRLGEDAPLPVEIMRFGLASTRRALRQLGLDGPLRSKAGGGEYETDNGNPVVDAPLPIGLDPATLAAALDGTPGVIVHGRFLNEADEVLGEGNWSVDRHMRQIPDHFHAHARDPHWWMRRFGGGNFRPIPRT